jgi:hypothetical protein
MPQIAMIRTLDIGGDPLLAAEIAIEALGIREAFRMPDVGAA